MTGAADDPLVLLRDVVEDDLRVFFEQQLDHEATAMAAFPSRDEETHFSHWHRIVEDPSVVTKSIVYGDAVAGNIVSWIQDGHREVGYWIGRRYWGKGIASMALMSFLNIVRERPLYAWVAGHNAASIRVLEKAGFVRADEQNAHLIYVLT